MATVGNPSWHNGGGMRSFGPAKSADFTGFEAGRGQGFEELTVGDPLVKGNLQKLKAFFGPPSRSVDPVTEANHEFQTYPEAFLHNFNSNYTSDGKGTATNNAHMETIIIEKTAATLCYPITLQAPWFFHPHSLDFTWQSATYHSHMLDKLPELAMARLVTNSSQSGKASMSRYGAAAIFEATFVETEPGKRVYMLTLEQMKASIITTTCMAIAVCVLEHIPYKYEIQAGLEGAASATSAMGIDSNFKRQKDMFGRFNKSPGGASITISKCTEILRQRAGGALSGDRYLQVIPEGTAAMISASHRSAYRGNASDATDSAVLDALGSKETIVESHPISQGHAEKVVDPYKKLVAVGDRFTIHGGHLDDQDPDEYRTSQMSVRVINRNTNANAYADFYTYGRHAGVWDHSQSHMPLQIKPGDIGRGFFASLKCYTWGQVVRKCMSPAAAQKFYTCATRNVNTAESRHKFVSNLRLFPANHPCVTADGRDLPEEKFKISELESHMRTTAKWSPAPNVETFRALMRNGTDPRVTTTDAGRRAMAVMKKRKAIGSEDDVSVGLTAEELFDLNADMSPDQDVTMQDSYEMRNGKVMRVPGGTAKMRTIEKQLLDPVTIRPDLSAEEQCTAITDSLMDDNVMDWIKAITTAEGASKTDKLFLLRQLEQTVQRAKVFIKARFRPESNANEVTKYRKDLRAIIDELFSRLVARTDLRRALNVIDQNEATRLEKEFAKGGAIETSYDDQIIANGRWQVTDGAKEDGQINLFSRTPGFTTNFTLPNDTYATTLAAPGKVALFFTDLDKDKLDLLAARLKAIDPALRRSRKDALKWSILLSTIVQLLLEIDSKTGFANYKNASLTGVIQSVLATVGDQLDSIKRYVTTVVTPQLKDANNLISTHLGQLPYNPLVVSLQSLLVNTILSLNAVPPAPSAAVGGRGQPAAFALPADAISTAAVQSINAFLKENFDPSDANSSLKSAIEASNVRAVDTYIQAQAVAQIPNKKAANITGTVHDAMPLDAQAMVWNESNVRDLIDRASVTHGGLVWLCAIFNIPPPFLVECERPQNVVECGTTVRQAVGPDGAARTYYQKPDFRVGTDPGPKLIYGNLSFYMAPQVVSPQKIIVMPNVSFHGYRGGGGMDINDPLNDHHIHAWATQNGRGSVFAILKPANYWNRFQYSWATLTGSLPSYIPHDENVAEMLHYPGCEAVAAKWGFTMAYRNDPRTGRHSHRSTPAELKQNVICFNTQQHRYNPSTKAYHLYEVCDDHFGKDSCYPGAMDVIDGRELWFQPPREDVSTRIGGG